MRLALPVARVRRLPLHLPRACSATPHPPAMVLVPAMMEVDILTLFPGMFDGVLGESILKRAIAKGVISVHLHQIRDYATDKHRTTDDLPYGGGAGMVMKCEPLHGAWQAARDRNPALPVRTVLLSPQGRPLHQSRLEAWAQDLPGRTRLILVCGRYEGVDERFLEECVDEEVSLGDFVLSGGEIAAMALVDGLMRLLPGALGNEASTVRESFSPENQGLLEAPQYTRPPEWRGRKVPGELLSGHHGEIEKWRRDQALERTQRKRPDLLEPSLCAPGVNAPGVHAPGVRATAVSGSAAADSCSSKNRRSDSPSLGGKSRGGKP